MVATAGHTETPERSKQSTMYEANNSARSFTTESTARVMHATAVCHTCYALAPSAQRLFDRCMELARAPSDYLH